jgi:malate dehydrogenase (oxaloacetate-decarboxylating)(NADP+)
MSVSEYHRGVKLLHDPVRNKGTAFTEEERDRLGLRGLLPPRICTQDEQVLRVLDNLHRKTTDLDRYVYLVSLQDRNEILFYRVLTDHLRKLMPLIYTPTVGKACEMYGHIFRRPRGLFLSARDRGRIAEILENWPHRDVRIIVVTDGERILGLGDLGANGMGIPVGKLTLYSACAGIHPTQCLPIMLDVGTDNRELLNDPLYIGLSQERLRGPAYDELFEEFVLAVTGRFPRAIIQLEDFANVNAFRLLDQYRDRVCLFDDDIQGTASVTLAGLYAAQRITQASLTDQRLLFLGAGEAGIGIGHLISRALTSEGLTLEEAHQRCWFFDTQGLVVQQRATLADHKKPFAQDRPPSTCFEEVVRRFRPTTLIGVSGTTGAFNQSILERMAEFNRHPIIFALSNPTSKSECSAAEAYRHTGGRAIFASGSPFDPVDYQGHTFVPGQANNAYIFPGVGLGAMACGATRITDEMFFVAARTLAGQVGQRDLDLGRLFPSLSRIRDVSAKIAVAVASLAWDEGLARDPRPADLEAHVRSLMFEPVYATAPVGDGQPPADERSQA